MSEPRVEEALRIQDLCRNLDKPWWRVPHLVKLNILLMVPFLTSYVSGFDGSMVTESRPSPFGRKVIGGVISLPIAPYLADKLGRRIPIAVGSLIIVTGSAVQGGAINMGMFIAGRGFVGVGGGIVATAAAPLLAELAYPTHRAIFTAVYNTTWYLGSIVAAWVTFGTFRMGNSWSWRIPSLLQALVSIVQVIFIFFVPESPRWLIANDQTDKATEILNLYHSGTRGEVSQLVRYEVAEITAAIEFERTAKGTSYLQFFRTRGNLHRLFIVAILGFIIQWCGNSLVSSYLALVLNSIGIQDPETQNLINGGLQIFNFIIAAGSAFLVDRLGRRFLFLASTIGMILAFIIWTILSARNEITEYANKALGVGVVAIVFVFYAFYNMAMSPLPIAYLMEILPFTLRAKGVTVFNFAQFGSSLFNGFVNPVGLESLGWKYYIVFVCALCLWLVVIYFTFPETRGMTLEEVSQVFDGREALAKTQEIKDNTFAEGKHHEISRTKSGD
ncbi:hypothetical protein ACJ41O_007471 [Fusarium nematophilum]